MAEYFDKGYFNEMDRKEKLDYVPLNPNQIAQSVGFMDRDILGKLRGAIFRGASKVEMTFFGGPGHKSDKVTPESMTPEIRQELRDMALINNVQTTTHATVNISGLAGIREDQFSDELRDMSIKELKQTINFASEATTGGAVVVHTGEFRRSVDSTPDDIFKVGEKENNSETIMLYNKIDRKIIRYPVNQKVPVEVTNEKTGKLEFKKLSFEDYKNKKGKINCDQKEELELFKDFYVNYVNRGKIREIEGRIRREKTEFESAKYKIKELNDLIAEETGDKKNYLIAQKKSLEEMRRSNKDTLVGLNYQLEEIKTTLKDFETVEDAVLKKTADSLSELGIDAMRKTKNLMERAKKEKFEDRVKPIFIAPENLFPDSYGSHPAELKRIIMDSRQAMVEKLKEKNYSESEAKDYAQKHIKATFDTGHMNIWWRYFKGSKKDMTEEQKRKEFGRWVVKEFKDLAKSNILGHIHLTDNLGYSDEHIVIGQGKAPIKEVMNVLKEEAPHLLDEIVVEPGSDNFNTILRDTWRELNSPVYSFDRYSDSSPMASFKEVSTSYLERSSSPSFNPSLSVDPNQRGYLFKTSYSGLDFR